MDVSPSSGEQRKTVTVLFCDLVGSTVLGETLDPERLRVLLGRYFERMKTIIEHHGGSVEKFIGDAVMAVFGVPKVHEDDALRAVRAALEMQEVLPDLALQGRIGIMTGEVVTGTQERLAIGDSVNVAARLEQAAQPGEVLIGESTYALVRDSVVVEALQPLDLKGKADPVPAYRLVRVRDAPERRHDARFVGRERELAVVHDAWERVRAEQRCELVTVIGDAGVGKSRLTSEFVASIEATTVRGRCLPYGDGITYSPVVEILDQLDTLPPDEIAASAIRSLTGMSEAETSAEEIAWAFRKTLEQAAVERPLMVVFDDIQWGEETFLDLIEHVALLSSGASILLLCMARPELGERRPTWPMTLRLEPLGDEDVERLIPGRLPGTLRTKIARASGGNPLFIGEMLAMASEADGEVVVPPTLHALLAARLDQLEAGERSVLERGAIEGEVFHRGAVQALAPEELQVTARLAALVRRGLIRPDRPQVALEDGFRFRHLLIRDAAYEAMPKATRAELHERFASWLETHGTELVELEELLGYHLERVCIYRAELGIPQDEVVAAAARRHLRSGGDRAALRQDYGAAVNLLERVAALGSTAGFDVALETELGEALFWIGKADVACRRGADLAERAAVAGDRVGELCGRIQEALYRTRLGPEGATGELASIIEDALPVFQEANDGLAVYLAYSAYSEVAFMRSRMDEGLEAYERAVAAAGQAGYEPPGSFGMRAAGRFFGSTPIPELLAWLEENEPTAGRDHFFRAYRAGALAMLGRFDEARAIVSEARAELAERGGGVLLANLYAFESVWVELWAGDPNAAAEFGAEGVRMHEALGEPVLLSAAAGNLAHVLYALDRLEEAEMWTTRASELATPDHIDGEMIWRRAKAKVLARRDEAVEAERLAREAIALGETTDALDAQGDGYLDLAEVLVLAGRFDEAAGALEQALDRYERKGNVVMAQRIRDRLREVRARAREGPRVF